MVLWLIHVCRTCWSFVWHSVLTDSSKVPFFSTNILKVGLPLLPFLSYFIRTLVIASIINPCFTQSCCTNLCLSVAACDPQLLRSIQGTFFLEAFTIERSFFVFFWTFSGFGGALLYDVFSDLSSTAFEIMEENLPNPVDHFYMRLYLWMTTNDGFQISPNIWPCHCSIHCKSKNGELARDSLQWKEENYLCGFCQRILLSFIYCTRKVQTVSMRATKW